MAVKLEQFEELILRGALVDLQQWAESHGWEAAVQQ
jgi:hypothetical protein